MLTKAGLTTPMGYVKFSSRSRAQRIARKLGLDSTHSHQMNGQRIYMPGSNHQALNRALRREGLPETMVPGDDSMGGGMPTDDLDDMMDPDLEPAVDDLLGDGLLNEDAVDSLGIATGDDDDDGDMEIY